MTTQKSFTLAVAVEENPADRVTTASAKIDLGTGRSCVGTGTAIRFPRDPEMPTVGDELAIARALVDLAKQVAGDAYSEIDYSVGRSWRSA
jgi:hypothetical protein